MELRCRSRHELEIRRNARADKRLSTRAGARLRHSERRRLPGPWFDRRCDSEVLDPDTPGRASNRRKSRPMSEETIADWGRYTNAEHAAGQAALSCHGQQPSLEHVRTCPKIAELDAASAATREFERRHHITRRRYYD